MLQWGRAPMSAEMWMRSTKPDESIRSFNGAALR